ncbi:hypothetical protein [Microtetraspora sp. NBRC 16547]|uniref:hypothetical protein n=1 Tax=Microtetraspora sp. NBRC 16547 TaxID=3030993 RepID=UPI0024A49C84|nr:hypothetical protein [Microtetraspora sp. NBRC 16547]GLX01472.1 hypothetical protein Misp02_55580 [Microtetraspora sp. NBRC 16547]
MTVDHDDLTPLLDRPWAALSHRQALAELVLLGWTPCGIGDWAVGLRSPSGLLAARVCPFDPAYAAFLELCRRCAGNPYLPRVAVEAELDGGGTLAVLEFLAPLETTTEVVRQWREGDGDAALAEVRRHAAEIDAEWRATVPWWDGIDLNAGNVRRALDGRIALIDVFCMDGAALYGQILKDATVVRDQLPHSRYVLDIPYIARESTPEEIHALRTAWTTGT